ncbi:MAG: peptidoglycan-binding domain-containing protein [Pseudomonadota bacterium]
MPVLSRARCVVSAVAVALALQVGPASAEPLTKERFEKAMEDVFSGKIFEAAVKQVREAHQKYVVKPASKNRNWPFYIPDQSNKPVSLVPKPAPATATVQPKAKPLVADPKVRRMQAALNTLGYDAGPADGIYGRKTAQAVERYQSTVGEQVTGSLTPDQRALLLSSAQKKRQVAAVQPKHQPVNGGHTVVMKQADTLTVPRPSGVSKQARTIGVTPTKNQPVPGDDAKSALPQSSDANPFDADDPDDVLPAQ